MQGWRIRGHNFAAHATMWLSGRRYAYPPARTSIARRIMNPYEANFSNTAARLAAWGRGMLRRYRRPLLAIAAASATMAIGVSAANAPAPAAAVETAAR